MQHTTELTQTHTIATRYEARWDEYSRIWATEPYFRKFRYLGDEWGSDEWVNYNFVTFIEPYLTPKCRVLEIGPGGGRYTSKVIGSVAELTGVDVSMEMVGRQLKRFRSHSNARFLKGDGRSLQGVPDGSIDLVFAFNVMTQVEVEDFYAYLLEIGRVLKPGGVASLHYAEFSGDEGWSYFDLMRKEWSDDPCRRGRFTELTLATMDMLVDRAGLVRTRNQNVARDAMVVCQKPAGLMVRKNSGTGGAVRRDYTLIDRYLDTLAVDVYHELPTDHHTEAAHQAVDSLLKDLDFESALELGCGSAPTLDRLAELGKKTAGVSLGAEVCAHDVVHEDMHFNGLPAATADLVIARHILEHSAMPILLLMEMHRLSKRFALVVVPCDEEIWVEWHNHYSVLSQAMWRKLFRRAGFTVLAEEDGPLEPDSTEWRFLLEKTQSAEGEGCAEEASRTEPVK